MKKYVIINNEKEIYSQHKNINDNCPFWGNGENAIIFTNKIIAKKESLFNEIPDDVRIAEWNDEDNFEIIS